MTALSAMNKRVKDPLYHFVISWSEGEVPDRAEAFDSVLHTLKALGFEGHQFVSAIHRDTDNAHVHVMVNRVNPASLRAVTPAYDYYVMDRCMRELEIRYDRAHAPGPYVVVERNGMKVVERSNGDTNTPAPAKPPSRPRGAERMEVFAGEESLYSYVRGEPRKAVAALLKDRQLTWERLHRGFREFGLDLRPKGRGLAVHAVGNDDIAPVKASSMHENLSLARLEKRLGAFEAPLPAPAEAPAHEPEATYTKGRETDQVDQAQPRSKRDPKKREERKQARAAARNDLKVRYKEYRNAYVAEKLTREDVSAMYAALRETHRARRAKIRALPGRAAGRKAMYSLLAFEAARDRLQLRDEIARKRRQLRDDPANRAKTYREWVEKQAQAGDEAALAQIRGWHYADQRAAKQLERMHADTSKPGVSTDTAKEPVLLFVFTGMSARDVLRDGSVVYWHNNVRSFVDHGRFVRMSRERDRDEDRILAMLLFAREKFGPSFRLTGTDDFKAKAMETIVQNGLDVRLKDHDQQAQLDALRAQQARPSAQ